MTTRATQQDQQYIKFWPMVAMASWRVHAGGAYRAWRLAHNADRPGSGKIEQDELHKLLSDHGRTNHSTRYTWINQAVEIGLFTIWKDWKNNRTYYKLASLARAAAALDCKAVGNPASISASDFIGNGWKAKTWGAFNATLSGPMSQKVKQELTGIDPRTQRNYLKQLPVRKHTNYAKRDLPTNTNYLLGYQEETGRTVFINEQGEVVQKLPDYIVVPERVATKAPRGRSRKAQQKLNTILFRVEQDSRVKELVRLWHDNPKGLRATGKRTAQLPVKDVPADVFLRGKILADTTFWEPISGFAL